MGYIIETKSLKLFIQLIPLELNKKITRFLWGDYRDWRMKLNITDKIKIREPLIIIPFFSLDRMVEPLKRYCKKCGEHRLYPITKMNCYLCDLKY